jgi:type II secretory pathway component PulK
VLEALFEDLDVDVAAPRRRAGVDEQGPEVAARAVTQYCALPMPCAPRPKQRTLASLDDLRVIRGFDEQVLRKLEPYVTALARAQGVNLNTAEARVWTALGCRVR